jgi:DNA-binding response OmpR family regulator
MNSAPISILVVDDDYEIRQLVSDFLAREGLSVLSAADGVEMDAHLATTAIDLIVLDLMIPGEDGLSICRRLRAANGPAILMLTAKSDEVDRIVGLEMGADDYLVKPFAPRELLARIRAIIRRVSDNTSAPTTRRFAFDRYLIDLDARELAVENGGHITLTSGEFDLLTCFITQPRRVLSRDHILDRLRGRGAEPFDRTVDMLVSRLRRKLDLPNAETSMISTVRNSGYLLVTPVTRLP